MKELTIISGKGGTGKTTVAAAFASLADNAVLADCDVDAADLHLIVRPEVEKEIEFHGLKLAVRDPEICTECGECRERCRFFAVDENYDIIPEACEGCGVCALVCPVDAIDMVERDSGRAYLSSTRLGPMAHAKLFAAEETSGKLVSMVRKLAKERAEDEGRDLVLIDGPPGTGCPVIAAITGADLVLVVTEPSLSGIHDLERVLGVADHFGIGAMVMINKYDINQSMVERIEGLCADKGIEIVGKLPYDNDATRAMIEEKTLIEYTNQGLSDELRRIWDKIQVRIDG